MNRVYRRDVIARAWSLGGTPTRRKADTIYVSGPAIYSYGGHFPMAAIDGGIVWLNSCRYSRTTGRHQASVRLAINRAGLIVQECGTDDLISHVGRIEREAHKRAMQAIDD